MPIFDSPAVTMPDEFEPARLARRTLQIVAVLVVVVGVIVRVLRGLLVALGLLGGDFVGELVHVVVGEEGVVAEVGVVVGAEVGVDDGLVGHHLIGAALGDDAALCHHHDPVGDVADHVHVVLDEQHRHPLVAQGLDVAQQ